MYQFKVFGESWIIFVSVWRSFDDQSFGNIVVLCKIMGFMGVLVNFNSVLYLVFILFMVLMILYFLIIVLNMVQFQFLFGLRLLLLFRLKKN